MEEGLINVLSGIEKAKLQAILKDVKFVKDNETDKYRCGNCGQVALYHYETNCKHILCSTCHGHNHNKPCPINNCTNGSINESMHNKEFEFCIYQLKAYCKFQQNGCEEELALSKLAAHQGVCKFSSINLLPKLWKPSPRYEYIKQLEEEVVCLKKIIAELIEQNDTIQDNFHEMSNQIDSQMKSVKQDLLSEVYKQVESLVESKLKNAQENVRCEDPKFANELNNQIETQTQQTLEMQSYQFNWSFRKFNRPLLWGDKYVNKTFISNDLKYAIYAEVSYDKVMVDYICIITKCFPYNEGISNNKCPHKTTLIIIDQGKSNSIKNIIRTEEPHCKSRTKTNSVSVLEKQLDNKYLKNDQIQLKIIIEPVSKLNLNPISSQNGTLIWKLNNFKLRKEHEINEFSDGIYSDYFSSSNEGYKMKVVAFISPKAIKINLKIVHGKYDYKLDSTFKRKVTFLILDQCNQENEKKDLKLETLNKDRGSFDDHSTFDLAEIEDNIYLKDDCLMIKVTVEAL